MSWVEESGNVNNILTSVKSLLLEAHSKEAEHIRQKLEELRSEDAKTYLSVIAKLLPYILPKMTETEVISGGEHIPIESWVRFT
jgi:formiminotetrahydrofolate cyclodeaminase